MKKSTMGKSVFEGEDDTVLEVYYDNRGEPYREGACIELGVTDYSKSFYVFLNKDEVIKLRDKLSQIIGDK